MAARGLESPWIDEHLLGFVADPLPGHEMYRGMLSVPYVRPSFDGSRVIASVRFRCIRPDCEHLGHGKYNTVPGDRPRLYNTGALLRADRFIAVTEGEIDALTSTFCGLPAVGIPGAQMWQDVWRAPFLGFETVFILADGDDAGMKFAERIATKLGNAKIIPCPPGHDVNSVVLQRGPQAFMERILGDGDSDRDA